VRVLVVEPLHSVGVRFIGGLLGPLVGYLVAFDTVVARAPSDFDADAWFPGAERADIASFSSWESPNIH